MSEQEKYWEAAKAALLDDNMERLAQIIWDSGGLIWEEEGTLVPLFPKEVGDSRLPLGGKRDLRRLAHALNKLQNQ